MRCARSMPDLWKTAAYMLGSNPIAIAMPASPYPFLFDASTTVVTRGKLEMYRKAEKDLPAGWALDETGTASTDAPRVLDNIVNKTGGGIMKIMPLRRVLRSGYLLIEF